MATAVAKAVTVGLLRLFQALLLRLSGIECAAGGQRCPPAAFPSVTRRLSSIIDGGRAPLRVVQCMCAGPPRSGRVIPFSCARFSISARLACASFCRSSGVAFCIFPCSALRSSEKIACLGNLLDNGIKYGSAVAIVVEDHAERLLIRVGDRGSGIPEGELERVFEPFHRPRYDSPRESGDNRVSPVRYA